MPAASDGQAKPGRGGSRSSARLGITSLACALVLLPFELASLAALGFLGRGTVISVGALVQVGLPLPAIIFGALGLARIKSVGAFVCALVGLALGVLELGLFTLGFVFALTHGDHLG